MISASFRETVSLLPTYLYVLLPHLSLLSSAPSFLYRCAVATPARMTQLPPSPPTHTAPTVFCRIRLLSLISDLHVQLPTCHPALQSLGCPASSQDCQTSSSASLNSSGSSTLQSSLNRMGVASKSLTIPWLFLTLGFGLYFPSL